MQALILAAGTGSRLGKYTKENTKCMLEINGQTLIMQALEKLNNVGIKRLILVVGYKKENLIRHVTKRYKNIHIEYVENPIYDKTNNIYSLFLAKDKLAEDDTILLESDLLFEESILKKLLEDKRKSLAVVDKYKSWMDGTSVLIDENDYILNFFSKSLFRFQDVGTYYKTVNIYKFSKEFSNKIYIPFLEAYSKAMGDNEYYESVLRVLTILEGHELRVLKLDHERWYEIDDVQDKHNAEIIFASSPKEKLNLIQKRFGGYWRFPEIKDFCYLVNPYFPPTKMQEEMKAFFYDLLSQYPSGLNTQNLLAGKMFGIETENIIVGNGASEIIRAIGDVFSGTFGMLFPTFNEYYESIGYDRVVQYIPNNDGFLYSLSDLKQLVDKSDNLILINPDNPSGHFNDKDHIIELLEYMKKKNKILILDESFVDFAENGEEQTMIKQILIDKYQNLTIIKSISKSYGVPGIRLGVVVSSNLDILEKFRSEITIWNINSFGEYFLQIIGKYKKDYKEACKLIQFERDRFFAELQNISYLIVYKSEANYFLCKVINNYTASELSEKMIEKDIYIKDLTGKIAFNGKEYIRIAVRDKTDDDILIRVLKELDIKKKNNWKEIWKNRDIETNNRSILSRLIAVDGFDTGYGTISENDWLKYTDYIEKKINLKSTDSLYEVGCGAGAFLYKFYNQGNRVGGIDYSENLIHISKKYLPNGNFEISEAINIDINEKYSYVISNSVFFYFPTYEYANEVIKRMIDKSIKGIAILEVNDYEKKDESMNLRKGYLSDEEYEKRYEGLEHLYYKKQWFIDIANRNNLKIEIEQQNIENYKNNMYRFNVFIYKG